MPTWRCKTGVHNFHLLSQTQQPDGRWLTRWTCADCPRVKTTRSKRR